MSGMVEEEGANLGKLGDYQLIQKLSEGLSTESYLAEQMSVKRQVILDRMKPELAADEVAVIAFLNDLKVKATIDHPVVGMVFEAVREGKQVFYTREVLEGMTLEEMAEENVQLRPQDWIGLIKQVAEASIHFKDKRVATMPMAPHHLYVDKNYNARLVNLAVCGPRDRDILTHDKQMLGTMILDLVKPGYPAMTRLTSLCGFMSDLDRTEPLSWNQIHRLCLQVEQQINEAQSILIVDEPKKPLNLNLKLIGAVVAGVLGLLCLIGIGKAVAGREKKDSVVVRELDQMVKFEKGRYNLHDGGKVDLDEFWIDRHEVTIAEYAHFLQELSQMSVSKQMSYAHDTQPEGKKDFHPKDWEAMYAAAKEGDLWEGVHMNPNCPVVNVTWWDAYAYAEWRGRRLPTDKEFFAMASRGQSAGALIVSGWGQVDAQADDLTVSSVHGLAGNVCEWMGKPAKNPAFPMSQPQIIICGASYQDGDLGARKRQWLDDRGKVSIDLGFRTASSILPEGADIR